MSPTLIMPAEPAPGWRLQPPSAAAAPSDEALAARARGGCAASFEELVRRYQVPLVRFLQRRGVPAEDVVQEAFLRAYQSLGRFADGRPFKPWLFTIAHRLSIDALRRAGRSAADPPAAADPPSAADPARRLEQVEAAEHLWAAVRGALGDDPYTAVWLSYAEGLDDRQVAAVMGRSWVWVRTTLHRARRRLAAVIPEPEDDHA